MALLVSVALVFLFIFSTPGMAHTLLPGEELTPPDRPKRTPIDPPVIPVPLPACPVMDDIPCTASATATVTGNFSQAVSNALLACDQKYFKCQAQQNAEYNRNKTRCIAVSGCQFSATTENAACAVDQGTDCTPSPYSPVTPSTAFSCNATGKYNITHYSCARPAPATGSA